MTENVIESMYEKLGDYVDDYEVVRNALAVIECKIEEKKLGEPVSTSILWREEKESIEDDVTSTILELEITWSDYEDNSNGLGHLEKSLDPDVRESLDFLFFQLEITASINLTQGHYQWSYNEKSEGGTGNTVSDLESQMKIAI